jgi:hypothetical protein
VEAVSTCETSVSSNETTVPVQNRVRVPDESEHEVRHDPDTLASSPDQYKGR